MNNWNKKNKNPKFSRLRIQNQFNKENQTYKKFTTLFVWVDLRKS